MNIIVNKHLFNLLTLFAAAVPFLVEGREGGGGILANESSDSTGGIAGSGRSHRDEFVALDDGANGFGDDGYTTHRKFASLIEDEGFLPAPAVATINNEQSSTNLRSRSNKEDGQNAAIDRNLQITVGSITKREVREKASVVPGGDNAGISSTNKLVQLRMDEKIIPVLLNSDDTPVVLHGSTKSASSAPVMKDTRVAERNLLNIHFSNDGQCQDNPLFRYKRMGKNRAIIDYGDCNFVAENKEVRCRKRSVAYKLHAAQFYCPATCGRKSCKCRDKKQDFFIHPIGTEPNTKMNCEDIDPDNNESICNYPTKVMRKCPIKCGLCDDQASPTNFPTLSPTSAPTSNPTASPTFVPTLSPTSTPTNNPTAKPTNVPTNIPTPSPSSAPTSESVSRSSLQEEIIKDMMPQSSSKCSNVGNGVNTTFEFQSSQAESNWNAEFVDYEQDLFLAKMQHVDVNNANRSWTIRLGQAGNIYSLVGPMGETVPPQDHDQAPWIDEVWQSVQPLGPNGDNDNNADTEPYFIHEAGTYQRDGDYTAKPFYSPSIGSYCDDVDGECGFASWGQQAHLPTPWKSPMLYFNRYVNCGNGVFEYTTLRHNNVGSEDAFGYLNVPWGGTRRSVLGDIVLTHKDTQEQTVIYPLVGWSDGTNTKLRDTMGYTIFAEDLPKGANPDHDKPYPLPDGLDLTIQDPCTCEGNCLQPTHRYVCKLVTQPQNIGWGPNRGSPGQIVRLEGQDTSKSVVAGIRHWAGNGRLYFYRNDDLTLEKVREALIPGTKVNVYHYLPPEAGKPEEDNLALAHVHGGQNGAGGNYPRVRYGAAGRDYNVYTVNDIPYIQAGSTYYYRQYFMMDAYVEMRSKGAEWAPEAVKETQTVGTIPGRTIRLYKSGSSSGGSTSFGHAIESDTCGGIQGEAVALACEGSTTPQANSKALFQIRCGDSYVVTEDMYHFSPSAPPYRSYVCDGMDTTTRPEWTLLGYFPVGSCDAIGSGYQYDEQYC